MIKVLIFKIQTFALGPRPPKWFWNGALIHTPDDKKLIFYGNLGRNYRYKLYVKGNSLKWKKLPNNLVIGNNNIKFIGYFSDSVSKRFCGE